MDKVQENSTNNFADKASAVNNDTNTQDKRSKAVIFAMLALLVCCLCTVTVVGIGMILSRRTNQQVTIDTATPESSAKVDEEAQPEDPVSTANEKPKPLYYFIDGELYKYDESGFAKITSQIKGYKKPGAQSIGLFKLLEQRDVITVYSNGVKQFQQIDFTTSTAKPIKHGVLDFDKPGHVTYGYFTTIDKDPITGKVYSVASLVKYTGGKERKVIATFPGYEVFGRGGIGNDIVNAIPSTDGSKILINDTISSKETSGSYEQFGAKLVEASTGKIIRSFPNISNATWLNNNEFVYWNSSESRDQKLYTFEISTGKSTVILNKKTTVLASGSFKYGNKFYTSDYDLNTYVFQLDKEDRIERQLLENKTGYLSAIYNDQKRLLFKKRKCDVNAPAGSGVNKFECSPDSSGADYIITELYLQEGGKEQSLIKFTPSYIFN